MGYSAKEYLDGRLASGKAIARAAASVSLVAMIAAGSSGAFAQSSGISEIIVTAQKREQNVQDVPIAVTAVTQESLQVNRVQNIMDLGSLAPGLQAKANAGSIGQPSFTMRGVFASAAQPSSDRQISTYIDGVYIGASRGSIFDLPDIQRIEVLRGPQGTLFGRNATAGAVSIVTRDPTGEFHILQDFTMGNYNQLRTRTSVDLPAFGAFSAYVTYVHDERRGDVRNLGVGTVIDRTSPNSGVGVQRSPRYLGNKNNDNIFAAVKFAPSDSFSMVYKFDHSDGTFTPDARVVNLVNSTSSSPVGALLAGILAAQPAGGGRYGPIVIDPNNKRPDAANNAWVTQGYIRGTGHSLTTLVEVSDNLSLKNISAYRKASVFGPASIGGLEGLEYTAAAKAFFQAPLAQFGGLSYAQIFDPVNQGNQPVGTYFGGYEGNAYGKQHQYSSEFQANYDSDFLTLTAGALYYRSKEISSGLPDMPANYGFAPVVLTPLSLGNVQVQRAKATSIAAYAQGEIHVTPQLDIVLGGRITKDKKEVSYETGGTFVGTRTDGMVVGTNIKYGVFKKTKPTYALGVNYKPTDDILLYGKYSTAFLSGGAVGDFPFVPETVASWEAGLKSEFFDRRLRVNLAVYDAKYKHSQSSQSGQNVQGAAGYGVVVIDNGPLKARGLELEVVTAPVEGLTIGGALGITDAKLTDPNIAATQGRPYKLIATAKWNGNVYGQYETQPIFDDATLFFRLDANYQGKYRNIPFTDFATVSPAVLPYVFNKARWIVNGRVAVRHIQAGPLTGELALWGRNLFNNRDVMYGLAFGDYLINSNYQPARTYGVDFSVRF